jgi:PAS domain S-box-containing protein
VSRHGSRERPLADGDAGDGGALLRRQELEIILDSVPAFVWYKDRENRIVRANRAAAEAVGRTPAELVGVPTSELFPDHAEDYYEADLEVIRSGQPKLGIVEPLRLPSGEERWVRTDKIPYRDGDGEIAGVIVFAVDITDQRRAQVALERTRDDLEKRVRERTAELAAMIEDLRSEIAERRQVEERLALALWSTGLGLWDWDLATDALISDDRWPELLGYEPGEVAPQFREWQSRVHPDDLPATMRALNEHVRERRASHYESEHRVRTRSGEYRWIGVRGRVTEWSDNGQARRMTGTFRDITARKHIEEQMRRQQAELAHVQRVHTVGRMAAELAHEINQPLGAIANFANGLANHLRRDGADPRLLEAAEQISAQALRAGQVLQRVREFSRKDPPRRVPADINGLIRDAIQLIAADARRAQIEVVPALEERLPLVRVDPIQVEQVILNLLCNGVESMIEAGGGPHRLVIASERAREGGVEVAVRDTGRGLAPEVAARVCEPFFTTKQAGLGMGLSISRSIIEAHGGTLLPPLAHAPGATFRFTLPPYRDDEP